ncbi:hypothetical protein EV180_002287 [Coemansia sp. RSA 518]|nr:hypothetical protein LPJ54_003911 [Coemansia sp. RSA 1824]KAJ2172576.1 hypothetical protein GGF45_004627 [Coemansia sp. RSA 551]KAJ2227833.1 hypothetical protein EV180_002287 [Coemansia sp. RSA 518]KAJ2277654.1 hypothetical protein GGH14_003208 [Coemansia sp. RSA 370]KAJ2287441.1 hypothetical protein IW141_004863 [Coemansia sp. RSA 355]
MCGSSYPPRYTARPTSGSSNSCSNATPLTVTSVEQAVEKVLTSPRVLDQIADRVAMRITSKIEKAINDLASKMHCAGKQSTAESSVRASELSDTSNSTLYYEYRTITQDEISSVMAAMPGVTWRRCKKNHLYAVGECGNPVVSGNCIECKTSLSR